MIEERGEIIQLQRYLAPLARYRFLILTFCLSAVLSSLALTYVASEKYLASAIVLHQPRETVSFQAKTRDALGFPLPMVALESIGITLQDIVKGDVALERIVRALRLDVEHKKPASNWFMAVYQDTKDWVKDFRQDAWQILKYGRVLEKDRFRGAMATLQKNISIKRTNKAYTFRLEVLDTDPRRAAQIVDTAGGILADLLVSEQVRTAREARENIERRLRLAAGEVEQTRNLLERYKQKKGISSLAEELSLRLKSINEFEQDLAKVRNELTSLENQRVELVAQLGRHEATVKYTSTTADNPLFNELRLDQARMEIERSGLLQKLTPKHQEVKAVDSKLAEVRERLSKELPKLLTSESTGLSEVHQKLLTDKLTVDSAIEASRAKESALVQTLSKETASAQKLIESEPNLGQIALRLKAAERSYELISEAHSEALLSESRKVSEVALQSPALVPSEPARPIKIYHVGVTLVLSLALAIGFVFLIHFFDSTVRDIEDAERALGLPVFATIPSVRDSSGVFLGKPV